MDFPQTLLSLRFFGSIPEEHCQLEHDERAKISRTRKSIEFHDQELIQRALIEERQISS
jgi:hypothetical protein